MDNVEMRQAVADISLEVRNFRKNRNGKAWHWSCLVCGDSRTNKRKARFGVALKDGGYVCHCFNCGYSNTFIGYLRDFHPNIYERVTVDSFINSAPALYDLNHLVQGAVSDNVLTHIFYIDKYSVPKVWLQNLEHKKISLSEKNLKRLYNIHRTYYKRGTNG